MTKLPRSPKWIMSRQRRSLQLTATRDPLVMVAQHDNLNLRFCVDFVYSVKDQTKVGDAADFLAMSDEDRQLLDTRVEFAQAVRRQREALHLSQKQLGAMLKTSQPRVAKIERAAFDGSMDQLIRPFTAVGGKIVVKTAKSKKGQKSSGRVDTLVLELATTDWLAQPLREPQAVTLETLADGP